MKIWYFNDEGWVHPLLLCLWCSPPKSTENNLVYGVHVHIHMYKHNPTRLNPKSLIVWQTERQADAINRNVNSWFPDSCCIFEHAASDTVNKIESYSDRHFTNLKRKENKMFCSFNRVYLVLPTYKAPRKHTPSSLLARSPQTHSS